MARNEVKPDWHPQRILGEVRAREGSMRALARKAGVGQNNLYNAVYRHVPKYEGIIAECLGVPTEEIWPSRYIRKVA
ncbi:TPA: helix-turn-helix domain-containing protein [Escherichia coli]